MNEEEIKKKLSPEEYRVLREKGTEYPFSGDLLNKNDDGVYLCKLCGQELFKSNEKYDAGSGWPSFKDVIDKGNVKLQDDYSHGMYRTEILCANCDSHLGHVWLENEKSDDSKGYYCINSVSLDFKPETEVDSGVFSEDDKDES